MAKSSVKQMEQDGERIIKELSKNANRSITEIAKTCGFSRQKVWRFIKNLEKNNTIWGYVAILDNEKLNKKTYIMLIKRSHKPVTKELINDVTSRKIANGVRKTGVDILSSHYTNGNYDWVIIFSANNIKEAKSFEEYYNNLYKGFLSDIHLIEIMFSAVKSGLKNPEIDKLKDFFNI